MFSSLCQQCFGPPLCTNHLAELARLPFKGTVADYQELFQMKMAHAGHLSPAQQVQLFTGGLPDSLRTDVELQRPPDLRQLCTLLEHLNAGLSQTQHQQPGSHHISLLAHRHNHYHPLQWPVLWLQHLHDLSAASHHLKWLIDDRKVFATTVMSNTFAVTNAHASSIWK